jgi:hypothetical protein
MNEPLTSWTLFSSIWGSKVWTFWKDHKNLNQSPTHLLSKRQIMWEIGSNFVVFLENLNKWTLPVPQIEGKSVPTGQRLILKEVTYYKIHILVYSPDFHWINFQNSHKYSSFFEIGSLCRACFQHVLNKCWIFIWILDFEKWKSDEHTY